LAPYQGYFFRILYARGAEAPGGPKKYVQNGRMTRRLAAKITQFNSDPGWAKVSVTDQ
jgi:hypothetical protein